MIFYDDGEVMIRTTVPEDVEQMKDRLREFDVNEIWASDAHTPAEALRHGIKLSAICHTALYKGRPVAMFGVCPCALIGDKAVIWMLGTDEIDQIKKRFMRLSRSAVRFFLSVYPHLENWVDARYLKTIKWLTWLGAEFEAPAPHGPQGMPFLKFTLKRKR
jgi:hypothetical protein